MQLKRVDRSLILPCHFLSCIAKTQTRDTKHSSGRLGVLLDSVTRSSSRPTRSSGMFRHHCSNLLRHTEAEDQQDGAAESCKQQLLLRRVFARPLTEQFHIREIKNSNDAVQAPSLILALLLHDKYTKSDR